MAEAVAVEKKEVNQINFNKEVIKLNGL